MIVFALLLFFFSKNKIWFGSHDICSFEEDKNECKGV